MAGVSDVLSEDQFLCCICLDVFTDPVTTPCGHSFCNVCINQHWDNKQTCPVCNEKFRSRPKMKTNTFMSEMVSEFKHMTLNLNAEPGTSGSKRNKKNHKDKQQLIPKKPICFKHRKQFMPLFCKDHSQLICDQCFSEHKNHNIIPLKEQCEEEQSDLQQKIQERREKIQELQRCVELSQENADREMKKGVDFFNDLMKRVQQSLDQFKQNIQKKHQEIKEKAEQFMKEAKAEISALEQRRAQMEEIWSSDDHFHFVQTFTLDEPAPELNDWTEVSVRAPSYEGRAAVAVSELMRRKLYPKIKKLFQDEVKRVKEHAVDVTLDPNTAHLYLDVSQNHKQVQYIYQCKSLPDNPERFSACPFVLGKEKFSSGRFYYEVEVKGKTFWCLGVASESVDRKETSGRKITPENGYWIRVGGSKYRGLWSVPEKVGVFVDYDEGLMCFFDAETSALFNSLTDCRFTENILPLFNIGNYNQGNNSAPLILTPCT